MIFFAPDLMKEWIFHKNASDESFKIKSSWQGIEPRLNPTLARASSIKNQNLANNVDSMTRRKVEIIKDAGSTVVRG